MQERFVNDPHRPHYHFLSPANWMNDPNGLVQWKGQYHLFYQYHPYSPLFGKIHWGHAVSQDLVHWTHLPIALTPTPGSVDEDGCWSGCLVDNNGIPTIIYSGNRKDIQLPCIATSHDNLITWEKYEGNPVITTRGGGLDIVDFRDHCVWKEDDAWYQLIGSGIKGEGGAALLYRSDDLIHWRFMHPLCSGRQGTSGEMWECPDFFPLGEKHVLIVSALPEAQTYYFIGTYQNHRFTVEIQGKLDASKHFYAPQSMKDDKGRRIQWGWIREGRDEQQIEAAGWAGAMSLPRILSLRSDTTLNIQPAPELHTLRGAQYHQENETVAAPALIEDIRGAALEISAEFVPGTSQQCGISIPYATDGSEQITIRYNGTTLMIDNAPWDVTPSMEHTIEKCTLHLGADETLHLHIYLDHSVIEVFANDRACITGRFYAIHDEIAGILPFALNGNTQLVALDIWEMRSIWTSQDSH